jgi:hypothetical protein
MKTKKIIILVLLVVVLAACRQNEPNEQTSALEQSEAGEYNMVGRWEMVGDVEGLRYVFEFYPDHTGVSFASPHSYRDIMFYVEGNDIRIDYYQGGEVSVSEIMEISFDSEDQITLQAEGAPAITLVRFPIPDTPPFVRARVALLVSNEEHEIIEAEQEDERTWYATVQVAGEEDPLLIKIYLDDSGMWMPSFVEPEN